MRLLAAILATTVAQTNTYTDVDKLPGTKRNEDNGLESDGTMPFAQGLIMYCQDAKLEVE